MRIVFIILLMWCSKSFASADRNELIALLEAEFGAPARAYSTQDFGREKYEGAMSIIIPEDNHRAALLDIREELPMGVLAYIGTTRNLSDEGITGVELVVIISDDKFDILRASQSDGMNYDLTNEKVIEKLQSWDEKFTIDIWHAESDTIQLTVKSLPENMTLFAREVYEFCPDIIDQGSGNISDISEYLRAEKAIYLWWD